MLKEQNTFLLKKLNDNEKEFKNKVKTTKLLITILLKQDIKDPDIRKQLEQLLDEQEICIEKDNNLDKKEFF